MFLYKEVLTTLITFRKVWITNFLAESALTSTRLFHIHAFTFSLGTCFPQGAGFQATLERVISPIQAHTTIERCTINMAASAKSFP